MRSPKQILRECYYDELKSLENDYHLYGTISYEQYTRYRKNLDRAFEDDMKELETNGL